MTELIEMLRASAPRTFSRKAYYSPEGDALVFYFDNPEFYHGERIDDFLTVYRKNTPEKELIGCQIKGVPAALKLLGDFSLDIKDNYVKLSIIFLGCMASSEAPKDLKRFYVQLSEAAKDAAIPKKDLPDALAA